MPFSTKRAVNIGGNSYTELDNGESIVASIDPNPVHFEATQTRMTSIEDLIGNTKPVHSTPSKKKKTEPSRPNQAITDRISTIEELVDDSDDQKASCCCFSFFRSSKKVAPNTRASLANTDLKRRNLV